MSPKDVDVDQGQDQDQDQGEQQGQRQEQLDVLVDGGSGMSLEDFISIHRNQFESSSVPQRFWENIYRKLANTVRKG